MVSKQFFILSNTQQHSISAQKCWLLQSLTRMGLGQSDIHLMFCNSVQRWYQQQSYDHEENERIPIDWEWWDWDGSVFAVQ